MSREVCGICWCPYDEDTGECACAPQSLPAQGPIAWYHVPYPNNGAAPMVSLSQQREPSMYGATVPLYLAPPQRPAEPVQEPVANRAFLERILTAMEGVIDVADRKTDEFDALRSCVIDLTMMLHTAPPQRKPEPVVNQQLTTEPVQEPVGVVRTLMQVHADGTETWKEEPVWAAPPQRKPLSEDEVLDIARKFGAQPWPPGSCVAFARAVEKAHGIGGGA